MRDLSGSLGGDEEMNKTAINKMTKEQVDSEFRRIISTYDWNTLVDLFEDRFNTKTKRDWINSFHNE
jgi:hypothetical protein